MSGPSRSSAIYARLLVLYPPEIRRGHRSEMLQNFDDLERASPSTTALWLVLGRDLVVTVGSHWARSVLGLERSFTRGIRIVALILALIIIVAWRRRPDVEPFILLFCAGYLIGWVAGWSRRRAVIVLAVLGIALSVSMAQRFALSLCYGCTLGWLAGWVRQVQPLRRFLRRDSRN